MTKTISRKIIIRESDLNQLMYKIIKQNLYDRVDYDALTYKGMQEDNLMLAIKGTVNVPKIRPLPDLYENMLYREKNLYNRRYLDWELTMDYPAGQVWVKSRSDQPRERLVVATLEKDIDVC